VQHRRIIKQGPVVLATREDGSMDPTSASSQGLFLGDTRFLSRFQLRINDAEPVLLGSTEEILFQASFLHTNPDLPDIRARGIGILQRNTIEEGSVQFEISLANWALRPLEFELSVELDSDFFDSFEARGVKRLKRGEIKPPRVTNNRVVLEYVGLDQVVRSAQIGVEPDMHRWENGCVCFRVALQDNERTTLRLNVKLVERAPTGVNLEPQPNIARVPKPKWFDTSTAISTDNAVVQSIIQRSTDDMEVLLTEWRNLWVPAAGLPRFTVPFGRDCLITGLMTLSWNPHLARDVLLFLAKTQGKEENPWNYEQPGKIMHELHTGELARLKEVPFGLFYGSVDSTPLFLVLGAEYIRWTQDLELFHELKPNFDAAWKWIDSYGHINDKSYIQYQAHTPPRASSAALTVGLFNQGWKDSSVAVMYSDGTMVTDHPVSLAEVQGELYRALDMWGQIYSAMPARNGMGDEGAKLLKRAKALKQKFNRDFWMPEKEYYAMALDGSGRQVDSITSNPAECLWARIIDDNHALAVAKKVLDDSMFSSWGVRTMANTEKAYNPLSYHDGSVWPFENAIIASGLKKYGCVNETQRIFEGLIDASLYFEYRRWPEVYTGVGKSLSGVLARQPDASRPQAWSAGSIFLLMQTVLGIAARPFSKQIDITPALPTFLKEVIVDNLSIAGSCLSLRLVRDHDAVLMEIKDNPNDLDILIHPATHHAHQLEAPNRPAVSGG
jgi:glycogen debranching enzyme